MDLDTEDLPEEALKLTQKPAATQKSAGPLGQSWCYPYVMCTPAVSSSVDAFQLLLRSQRLYYRHYAGEDHPEYQTSLNAFT